VAHVLKALGNYEKLRPVKSVLYLWIDALSQDQSTWFGLSV